LSDGFGYKIYMLYAKYKSLNNKVHRVCFITYIHLFWGQGAEYEEFVKAATSENEVQFVETNDRNVAKILFPGIASEEQFLGLVKSEPEKFEKFSKFLLYYPL
jgi:hypothetical protein